jgi:hypothetical protein
LPEELDEYKIKCVSRFDILVGADSERSTIREIFKFPVSNESTEAALGVVLDF